MSDHLSILQVDDDGYYAAMYRRELEDMCSVMFCKTATDALHQISTGAFHAVLLDIMMDCPTQARKETNDGESTGVWILEQRKETIINLPLPILVLTNRKLDEVRTDIEALQFPDGLVEIHAKKNVRASELPDLVRQLVAKWPRESTDTSR